MKTTPDTTLAGLAGTTAPRVQTRRPFGWKQIEQAALWLLIAALSVGMLLPLLWVISTALKGNSDIYQFPPVFIPNEFHWENFVEGPQSINFPRHFLNSIALAAINVAGSVSSSMIVGYGLARIRFPGRRLWFYLFIGSMMFPAIVGVFPLLRLMDWIGWYDTWLPLTVPAWLGNPLFIFLARQYYLTIPHELDEAAKLDGAGHWTIFTQLMVPLTRPVWITMMILAFQGAWNDYLNPLIYLITDSQWPLSVAMATFAGSFAGVSTTRWNLYMATNLLFMLPPLILFFLAQRYFMEGLGSLGATTRK